MSVAQIDQFVALPDDLTELPQWGMWRDEDGKKVPYQGNGRRASSSDPRTWATFEQVIETWNKFPLAYSGLAYFFSPLDPFTGGDLDDCLSADGTPAPWADRILRTFGDTYSEISPSLRGVKFWCRARLPRCLGKVSVKGGGGIELYDRGRYFTVTGRRYRGAPLQVEDHQADIDRLFTAMTQRSARAAQGIDAAGKIPFGRQHLTLVSLAGTLRRRGVCTEAVEACLQEVNRRQCERPGPPENIRRIAESTRSWQL